MLARTFLTSKQLGITDIQRDALITTLGMLERGELKHTQHKSMPGYPDVNLPLGKAGFTGHFNMAYWSYQVGCGTLMCLGGTSAIIAGDDELWGCSTDSISNKELRELFMPGWGYGRYDWDKVTTEQAAAGLSNYLTRGSAHWGEVLESIVYE